MDYKVQIHHAAQKQMLSLPRQAQVAIARGIDRLVKTPRPSGCKKLQGTEFWRFRLGRYRVIYTIDDDRTVTVVKVALRREDTYK